MLTTCTINKMTAILQIDAEIIQIKELPENEDEDCIYGAIYEYDDGTIIIKWNDNLNTFYVYNKCKFIEKTSTPKLQNGAKVIYTKLITRNKS